jgi:hypothetical protein
MSKEKTVCDNGYECVDGAVNPVDVHLVQSVESAIWFRREACREREFSGSVLKEIRGASEQWWSYRKHTRYS